MMPQRSGATVIMPFWFTQGPLSMGKPRIQERSLHNKIKNSKFRLQTDDTVARNKLDPVR